MAITFSIRLGKEGRNGRKVYIRCTYKRQSRDIPTNMYVTPSEVTRGGKIKNVLVLNRCQELITEYRQLAYNMQLESNDYTAAHVFDAISDNHGCTATSFTKWALEWCEKSKRKGTDNYKIAFRALQKFMGKEEIKVMEVNHRNMAAFIESLDDKPRAKSLYPSAIVKIFNDLREFYWDETRGESFVKDNLGRLKVPKQGKLRKEHEMLQIGHVASILSLAHVSRQKSVEQSGKNLDKSHLSGRAILAVDCWVLSFSLMGINSVDLYELQASQFDGKFITYNRHKTRDRRQDGARMVVAVPSFLLPLLERYKGSGGALFCFSQRYATYKNFQIALNIGLKEVGALLGVPSLSFYSARHSFASIAVNVAGVDKYTCGEMLCHVDTSMRVTDTYIAKDWGRLHAAQAKVLAVVMGEGMG